MQGAVFLGDRRVEIREFSEPDPGPGDVVVPFAPRLCVGLTFVTTAAHQEARPTPGSSWAGTSRRGWCAPWEPMSRQRLHRSGTG